MLTESYTRVETPSTYSKTVFDDAEARRLRIHSKVAGAAALLLEAGLELREVHAGKEWETLSYSSFDEYCESVGVSPAYGYDMIRFADFADRYPDYVARALDAGFTKVRALLGKVERADVPPEEDLIDEWLDEANTLPTRELMKKWGTTGGQDMPPSVQTIHCPHCARPVTLLLSRAAQVSVKRGSNGMALQDET